jgi:DNA-binding response OmpR family regulator
MTKILIVEDDKILSSMYRVKFTNSGFEVKIAENGEEGLKFMKSFNPDIVLMDLMMPIMDGFTALKKAKTDPKIANIPIVILTNLSQVEDAAETLKIGAAGHLVKSNFTPAELVEKTKEFLLNSKS